MKLIIIGNGMDISHGLNTKWQDILSGDFRRYLEGLTLKMKLLSNDSVDWSDFENDIKSMVMAHLSIFWKEKYIKNNLKKSLNDTWLELAKYYRDDMRGYTKGFYSLNKKCLEGDNISIKGIVTRKIVEFHVNFKDYSAKIINKIAREIQEEVKVITENGLLKKEKITDVFEENDFVVINYNYTKIYEDKYFKPEDVVYIHNSIDLNDNFESYDEKVKDNGIMLGYYKSSLEDLKFHKDKWDVSGFIKPVCSSLTNEKWNDFLKAFIVESGYKILNFTKTPEKKGPGQLMSKWSEIKEKIKSKKSKIDEIVFLGHSINDIDITELNNKLSLKNIKKITSYNRKFTSSEEIKHIEKIKKHWSNLDEKPIIEVMPNT